MSSQNTVATASDETGRTFKIPAENLERLDAQIEVVNKRIRRMRKRGYDLEEVRISRGQFYREKVDGQKIDSVYIDVVLLSPEPPKISGWEFIAALTHVEGVGTVLRVCPGATVAEGELKRFRNASPDNCDHCHSLRKRLDTFVIRDQQGGLAQIGRQCLQAYTGLANLKSICASAEVLLSLSELLEDAEDKEFCGGGGKAFATIEQFLPYVACSIRIDGWLSRTAATEQGSRERSTCDLACSCGIFASADQKYKYEPEEKDFNLAAATIEFCENHFAETNTDDLSDYENSLRVAMASGIAHPKMMGIIASAIMFYRRDLERRARNNEWAQMVASSKFQGVEKERQVWENLRVLSYRTSSNDFGTTHFYSFVDENNNAFVYWASRDFNFSPGQVVSLLATVKKHETYTPKFEGAKSFAQTVLTRGALVTRVKVLSEARVEKYMGKMEVTNPEEVKQGGWAQYKQVMELVYEYNFESSDGRRFSLISKSRKKALKEGAIAIVSYDAWITDKVCPVSLVKVVQ